jgi:hypothetical protein
MYRKKPQANLRYVERTALASGEIFPADLKKVCGIFLSPGAASHLVHKLPPAGYAILLP